MSKALNHAYGLSWIDEEALFEATRHCFAKVIGEAQGFSPAKPPDMFALTMQAVLLDQGIEDAMSFEKMRKVNKSISNAVGVWHQTVLGLAEGWENRGTTGGGIDIVVRRAPEETPVFVEVKNRYNTIKRSEEKRVWDNLDSLARANGTKAYVVQIVPETPERYDRPWKVSGRQERESVRCCDGATAYEWAFGKADALEELFKACPLIFSDVVAEVNQPAASEGRLLRAHGDFSDLVEFYERHMPQ